MVTEIRINGNNLEFEDVTIGTKTLRQVDAALIVKVTAFLVRDLTAASGDVAYTGINFLPSALHVIASVMNTTIRSNGFSDSAKYSNCDFISSNVATYSGLTDAVAGSNIVILLAVDSSNYQKAIVKTYNDDGFILTWTKVGLPTGIGYFSVKAFRDRIV